MPEVDGKIMNQQFINILPYAPDGFFDGIDRYIVSATPDDIDGLSTGDRMLALSTLHTYPRGKLMKASINEEEVLIHPGTLFTLGEKNTITIGGEQPRRFELCRVHISNEDRERYIDLKDLVGVHLIVLPPSEESPLTVTE